VDSKSRIWRTEIDKPGKLFGVLKEDSFRDSFFENLKVNTSGLYLPDFSYLSTRGTEQYFVAASKSPIIFTNLINDMLIFGSSLTIPFEPANLVLIADHMYHSIEIPHKPRKGEEGTKILGLLERNLAYSIMQNTESEGGTVFVLWKGKRFVLKIVEHEQKVLDNPHMLGDVIHVQHKTKWWTDE